MLRNGLRVTLSRRGDLDQLGQVDRRPSQAVRCRAHDEARTLDEAEVVLDGALGDPEVGREPRCAEGHGLPASAAGDQVDERRDRPRAQVRMGEDARAEPPDVAAEGTSALRQAHPAGDGGPPRPTLAGDNLGDAIRHLEEGGDVLSRPAPLKDAFLGLGRLPLARDVRHCLKEFE